MTARRWWLGAVSVVVAVGALLRFYGLNRFPGLNPDEVEIVLQWFGGHRIYWYVAPSGRPHLNPLGPLLLWPFATFANPAPWLVRMPSVIAGLALLPLLFKVTRDAFGRRAAISALLLAASSPILIAYSRIGWDPAYVPLVSAAAVGAALRRRLTWVITFIALLVLVHPTAAFVMIIVAAPFISDLTNRVAASSRAARRRLVLTLACLAGYAGVIAGIVASVEEIPMGVTSLPRVFEVIAARLRDAAGVAEFAGGYWQAIVGGAVYTGFVSGADKPASAWPVAFLLVGWAVSFHVLRRQGRPNEASLLMALPCALLAQYVSQGSEVATVFRERYLLWAIVPSCLAVVVAVHGICDRWATAKWASAIVLVLSSWLVVQCYAHYVRPFQRQGGTSGILDYRTAATEPKEAVLKIIRAHRRYPANPATIFVGEGRLHLSLMYLASRDDRLDVRNLGAVLYQHYQRNDYPRLLAEYEAFQSEPRDVFFVDYEWGRLPGPIRDVHLTAAKPVASAVAPWMIEEVQAVGTNDGQPLLKVWGLTRR